MASTENTSAHSPTLKDRAKILSTIKNLVIERHINVSNPNQEYGPWLGLVAERTPGLMDVDGKVFENGVGELLKALGSSHTAFFHRRRNSIPAPYSINATLRPIDTATGKRWMFVDVIE